MPVSGIDSLIKEPKAQEYWLERIVAFIIDAIIVYVVVGLLAVTFAIPIFFIAGIAAMVAMITGVFSFAAGVVLLFYFALFEVATGSSLGKRMVGLAVRSRSGGNPSLGEAFARNISKVYWALLFLDIIVGLATSKEYTQKFSDRFVGTSVVKRRA
jgi:uncharacterized RDD family membrane protein YckC